MGEVVRMAATNDVEVHDSWPYATQTWKAVSIADYCRSSEATGQVAVDIDFHQQQDST